MSEQNLTPQADSDKIGVVVFGYASPFYGEFLQSVAKYARGRHYDVVSLSAKNSGSGQYDAWEALRDTGCKGIVMYLNRPDNTQTARILNSDLITVLVNHSSSDSPHRCIYMDNVRGGELAAEHFIEHGHQKLAMITGPKGYSDVADRTKGFQQALSRHEIKMPADLIVESDFSIKGGAEAFTKILHSKAPFSAVFAHNDYMAIGVLQACAREGIAVPGELSVIGYDDTLIAKVTNPGLTTVRYPIFDAGEAAVKKLFALMDKKSTDDRGGELECVPPKLIVRASVGPLAVSLSKTPCARRLTPREVQCLELMAIGDTNQEISEKLSISEHTVNFHLKNSLHKLQAKNRTHAVVLALASDVINVDSHIHDS